MRHKNEIDWSSFWIREILFLGVPALIAVLTIPEHTFIQPARAQVVVAIQLFLSALNVFWALFRQPSHRTRL